MRLKHLLNLPAASLLFLLMAGCANNGGYQGAYASPPVGVWGYSSYPGYAYGSYGSYGAWNHSTGVAYGAYGSSAAWHNGAGYAHGAYGGSAAWDHGSGVAYGAHGGSAAWSNGSGYATSPTVRVLVRRQVGLRGLSASVTRSSARGRTVLVTAVVVPAEPAVAVTLTVYEYSPSLGRYVQVSTVTRASAGGLVPFSWRPTTAGRYYLRLTTPPTALFANGISAAYRWVVY